MGPAVGGCVLRPHTCVCLFFLILCILCVGVLTRLYSHTCVFTHLPVCVCLFVSSFLPPVLAAAVTQASLRSMLHKLLTAGPSAFNITALLSQAQHYNQGTALPAISQHLTFSHSDSLANELPLSDIPLLSTGTSTDLIFHHLQGQI